MNRSSDFHSARPRRLHGISLVELILTVATVAMLATVAGLAVSHTGQRSQSVKLRSDVETVNINGVSYRIRLQFGATDSFGFASQDQFHVYEGATGQGELLGTFLPN